MKIYTFFKIITGSGLTSTLWKITIITIIKKSQKVLI